MQLKPIYLSWWKFCQWNKIVKFIYGNFLKNKLIYVSWLGNSRSTFDFFGISQIFWNFCEWVIVLWDFLNLPFPLEIVCVALFYINLAYLCLTQNYLYLLKVVFFKTIDKQMHKGWWRPNSNDPIISTSPGNIAISTRKQATLMENDQGTISICLCIMPTMDFGKLDTFRSSKFYFCYFW